MLSRVFEASVLTALVVPVLAAAPRPLPLEMAAGTLVLATLAVLRWLALAASAVRALRRKGPPPAPAPTLTLVTRPTVPRYVVAAVVGVFGTVTLAGMLEPAAPIGAFAFPLAIGLGGAAVAAWTFGVRIDPRARQLVHWRGIVLGRGLTYAFVERAYAVDPSSEVVLDREYRSSSRGSGQTWYTIAVPTRSLDGRDAMTLSLYEDTDQDGVRLRAEQVAKALELAVVDRTAAVGGEHRRAAHELDQPLAEQLRRRGAAGIRPALPPASALALESDALPWIVRVRPRGLRVSDAVKGLLAVPVVLVTAAIPGAILASLADGGLDAVFVPMTILISIAALWLAVWRPILRDRRQTQLINLSPTRIRVARRAPGSLASGELESHAIEDIVVCHAREPGEDSMCVVARGDGHSLLLAHALSEQDAIWLRDAAVAALAPRGVYR